MSRSDEELQASLVGTYRLVSVESTSEDGEVQRPFGEDPDGFMTFTPEGYMLALLALTTDRPSPTGTSWEVPTRSGRRRFSAPARSPAASRCGRAG